MTAPLLRFFQYVLLAATVALVLVFYFQTRLSDLDTHSTHSQDILHLKQLDTLLEDEALKIVALQIVQYDPLVDTVTHIRDIKRKIFSPETGIRGLLGIEIDQQIDALDTMIDTKIDLIETIKSRTAIIRNTLNFLPLEVARITENHHAPTDAQIGSMLSMLLSQNINPTPHNLENLENILQTLHTVKAEDTDIPLADLKRILTHARANIDANADVSALMREFLTLPTRKILDTLFSAHTDFVIHRIKSANEFRVVLLVLTLLLFGGLALALHSLRKSHDEAKRTTRQFRDAVESIAEGFAFFDSRGKLQFWNETFAKLHRGDPKALTKGITYDEFYEISSQLGIYREHDAKKTQKAVTPIEVCTDDGIWMLASDSPMADGGTACVRIDITQNKLAEHELRKLSRAVEQSPASVIITDTSGIISYVNPKFSETTGYSAAEAIGQTPNLVSSGERPQSEYKDLWAAITNGKEWRGEFHNKRKDGTLFWEFASISPIKNEHGVITHFLAVKEDITERKNTIAQLVKAKEQAELASHAKTQFLANMSHELRTPLNAIIGFSEILKDQMFGPLGNDQYLDYTKSIYDSGAHLLEVINDILDISRIETGAMEIRETEFNLTSLAKSCCDMVYERAARTKLTLRTNFSDKPMYVFADEIRLKQVMLNLLTNAIKFTPDGGDVSLSLFNNENSEICIAVADTGFGIPKHMHQRVLEPFEQVSDIYTRNHEGSGLGLYLVNAFTKLHGGHVQIDSELDCGTTVTVSLPADRARTALV